jgi:ABC-type xylose transport system permease subunit
MGKIFNVVMRIVSTLLGVLVVVMGGIWILQGLNMAPPPLDRSFMVNDLHWAFYGAILALVGLAQIVWSNIRQRLD